ncbi:unnamed protein product, partial [Bubo scandiacus]
HSALLAILGVFLVCAVLPYPWCFLKKRNVPVPLHHSFALEGKKGTFFWFKAYGMHLCALAHANT